MSDSEAYKRFHRGFFEADSWELRKDGPPLECLDDLTDQERERAGQALVDALKPGDSWPIIALGHLKSQQAVPALRKLLGETEGIARACAATSIWHAVSDPSMIEVVLEISHQNDTGDEKDHSSKYILIDVIYMLSEFPDPSALERLDELTMSKIYLVRYNAKEALEMWKDRWKP